MPKLGRFVENPDMNSNYWELVDKRKIDMDDPKIRMEAIGGHIRWLREMSGLSLQQVCEDMLYDASNMSKLERGVIGMSLQTACKIAHYFEITLDHLVGVNMLGRTNVLEEDLTGDEEIIDQETLDLGR